MATNNQINTLITATPTALAASLWDANKNMSAVSFIPGYTTTVTSASPVTLVVGSNQQQYFTGSTAQTLTMPVANTLVVGQNWNVINNSSAAITINSSGGNLILTLPASSETVVTCVTASGTTAASWTTSPAVSGSGTVTSGLINQLAYYAAAGTTVSGLATANSSGLLTNGSGVPAWVTVTGTGAPVLATSPTLITPTLGAASATSVKFASGQGILDANSLSILAFTTVASSVNNFVMRNAATNTVPQFSVAGSDTNIGMNIVGQGTGGVNIKGTGTNDSGAAGFVGENISSVVLQASTVSLVTATAKNITSISLTAGDWDVFASIAFLIGGTCTQTTAGISNGSSATLPVSAYYYNQQNGTTLFNNYGAVPMQTISIASTTTIYLVALAAFTTSTVTAFGSLIARRVR